MHVFHVSYIINNGEKKKEKCFTLFTTYSVYGITYFISILKYFGQILVMILSSLH